MKALSLLALLALCGIQDVQPQAPPPKLSDLEVQRNLEEAKSNLESLKTALRQANASRRADCLSAFGNAAFCDCLSQRLPAIVDFPTYVALVITPKEEIAAFTETERQVAVKTRAARDQCVAQVFDVKP